MENWISNPIRFRTIENSSCWVIIYDRFDHATPPFWKSPHTLIDSSIIVDKNHQEQVLIAGEWAEISNWESFQRNTQNRTNLHVVNITCNRQKLLSYSLLFIEKAALKSVNFFRQAFRFVFWARNRNALMKLRMVATERRVWVAFPFSLDLCYCSAFYLSSELIHLWKDSLTPVVWHQNWREIEFRTSKSENVDWTGQRQSKALCLESLTSKITSLQHTWPSPGISIQQNCSYRSARRTGSQNRNCISILQRSHSTEKIVFLGLHGEKWKLNGRRVKTVKTNKQAR